MGCFPLIQSSDVVMNKAINDDFGEMTAQTMKFKHVYLFAHSNVKLVSATDHTTLFILSFLAALL